MTDSSLKLAAMISIQMRLETKLTPKIIDHELGSAIKVSKNRKHLGGVIISEDDVGITIAAGIKDKAPQDVHDYLIKIVMQYNTESSTVH